MPFTTNYSEIIDRVNNFNPLPYANTRNYSDGAVSRLSPYISRGVISTIHVASSLLRSGYKPEEIEKFIQELAWRDYWQICWQHKNVLAPIKSDFNQHTERQIPTAIVQANTGIHKIDEAINELYETGYMHNHMRMYVAMLVCNIANCDWLTGAKWMYYHLLDGDPASNMLSWQWICGANSNKKYYANQENINRFFKDNQTGTYLDVSYDKISKIEVPNALAEVNSISLVTERPSSDKLHIKFPSTLLYTPFNLDPVWRSDEDHNRILILENDLLNTFSCSNMVIDFMLSLGKNIDGLQLYVGSFEQLCQSFPKQKFIYKEHPTNNHFRGIMDQREWLFEHHRYASSFFKFWNKAKKEMKSW